MMGLQYQYRHMPFIFQLKNLLIWYRTKRSKSLLKYFKNTFEKKLSENSWKIKFISVTNVKTESLPLLKLKQIHVCVLRLDNIV